MNVHKLELQYVEVCLISYIALTLSKNHAEQLKLNFTKHNTTQHNTTKHMRTHFKPAGGGAKTPAPSRFVLPRTQSEGGGTHMVDLLFQSIF